MDDTTASWFSFRRSHPALRYVRLSWVDYSGVLRTRILLADFVQSQLDRHENGAVINVANAIFDFPLSCPPIEGSACVGELFVIPDFDSLRIHPHRENRTGKQRLETASVMCCIVPQDDRPPLCPRMLYQSKLKALNLAGVESLEVGFEIEFSIFEQFPLDKEGRLVPIALPHSYATSRLFQGPKSALVILEEIVEALQIAGIEVLHFHAESGPGTYEVVTGPLDAIDAVDSLVLSREIIQYVCAQYGFRATFLPKPIDHKGGVGSHAHLTMEPSSLQWDFFGGILKRLPLITAIAYGNVLSYDRAADGYWCGGTWASWGRQNKETCLRLISEDSAHWEIKSLDGVGNIYLAMAAILQAGTEGLKSGSKRLLGEGCHDYPDKIPPGDRKKVGLTQRLPDSMEIALKLLREDLDQKSNSSFCQSYGRHVIEHYMKIKNSERQLLGDIYGNPKNKDEIKAAKLRQKAWVAQNY